MDDAERGQVSRSAAEIYDKFFLPALFEQWTPHVADAASIGAGDHVLDVACGTGVLACEAARRVGAGGAVSGLDRNEGMLAMARRKNPAIDWRPGLAEKLPFDAASFDVVVSQFGLMFFEDRAGAIREMWRVLRPRGRLALAVWDASERSPGYADMIDLLQRLFGARIADALHAPFALGDPARLRALFDEAGVGPVEIRSANGTARFPSIDAWVHTDIKGWTLADLIDDAQYGQLKSEARTALARHVGPDGGVTFAAPALIAVAAKP